MQISKLSILDARWTLYRGLEKIKSQFYLTVFAKHSNLPSGRIFAWQFNKDKRYVMKEQINYHMKQVISK